ncbi:Src-domain containing protein [Niveomyces insectorum RCEF 264]|uniref:Src-domain containing protein n=1 Tax=Niveomyces insectorum RCEF 264 TaxID=1081102 RepID=A0A167UM24_9HYPO|nr:Src-domain containing protein [Niveomyces insectorum RCEF 264]
MALPAPPPLPTRFPCWCRAVYSWGGESCQSKRDLGFIEGDLIECLNAGDGSWWTGRLRRDRRIVGAFPSNFVEVLPDDFHPVSRSVSPLPPSNTPSPKNTPQKSKTFRRPFEAYAKAPHYTTAKQPETYQPGSLRSRETSANSTEQQRPNNHTHIHTGSVTGSLTNSLRGSMSRVPSPSPLHAAVRYEGSRSPSPGPAPPAPAPPPPSNTYHTQPQHYRQTPSPAPPQHYSQQQQQHIPLRQPSPIPALPPQQHHQLPPQPPTQPPAHPPQSLYQPYRVGAETMVDPLESPPPPPPPHRHVLGRHGSNASYDSRGLNGMGGGGSGGGGDLERHGSNLSYNSQRSAGYHTPRVPSPCPPSPGMAENGLTPSPLREAMDGVIEQLDALGMSREVTGTPEPPASFDPWSPESFDMVHQHSRRKPRKGETLRPQTSMGIAVPVDEGYETYSGSGSGSGSGNSSEENTHHTGHDEGVQHLPQLSNYVERMESRLRSMHQQHQQHPQPPSACPPSNTQYQGGTGAFAGGHEPPPPPPKGGLYERPKSSMDGPLLMSAAASGAAGGRAAADAEKQLRHRRSAYDVGRQVLNRTFTTKTNSTNASSGTRSTVTNSSTNTQSTNRSLMSGVSAGGISATSAGSLARKSHSRAQSALGMREWDDGLGGSSRPESPFTGVTYHSSHATDYQDRTANRPRSKSQIAFDNFGEDLPGLGGLAGINSLAQPKTSKKGNFFKKIIESAKTGVASSRGSIAMTGFGNTGFGNGNASAHAYSSSSPMNNYSGMGIGTSAAAGADMGIGRGGREAARAMGLGGGGGGSSGSNSSSGVDWVQVRRDVNRSNSLSRIERHERRDRCQMMDYPTLDPVDELYSTIANGDEGADGMPVTEPTNYGALNLSQVDKNSRFISSLPPMTTAITLATTYVCRPYRSDVQRLRAIFTWVAEKIVWEDDYEVGSGGIDTRRVIQTKRGCAEEYAMLVADMCAAAGLSCEVVRGYLKAPGDIPELGIMPRSNHWWNAVLVDNEWRVMDCCLASPSFPRRAQYSSGCGSGSTADPWWFLVRPSEACYTHIPEHHTQQHLCPPVAHEILQNLPCASPPYFRNGLQLVDFSTSLLRIEDLEMVHIRFSVPEEVEVAAEVEVRALTRDADGDYFESGDVLRKRALAQADWVGGTKRYTVKALLPGDEGTGILRVYAGRRGLMHSIKDIPHPLAFALPIVHTGENPPYEFVMRHPTPHAQRHDIYVVQPQCQRLALNNTFVFAIRQHPSTAGGGGATPPLLSSTATPHGHHRATSPAPFARPSSALSMTSSAAGSNPSTMNMHINGVGATTIPAGSVSGSSNSSGSGSGGTKKPAKLAIQTPGGKILRLMRKEDRSKSGGIGVGGLGGTGNSEDASDGGTWETIIKCSERGVWRGLVLADRTARWCVFAEWICQ